MRDGRDRSSVKAFDEDIYTIKVQMDDGCSNLENLVRVSDEAG